MKMSGEEKTDNGDTAHHQNNGVDGPFKSADEESVPCLEDNEKAAFWRTTEQKLLEKSGLTQKGLYYVLGILFTALFLLIVVITLAACWPITPHHHRFPVCTEETCLRAATQIRQYMNEDATKCEDIVSWACGTWMKAQTLPPERSKWNRRVVHDIQEAVRIRELISTLPLPLSRGSVEWKLKYFYDACIDVDSVNADGGRPLNTIISELGGWHLLRNWNADDFNFDLLLRDLHVKYGVSPYFKITTVPNSREPGNSSIMILPSGLGLPDKSYYYMDDDKFQRAYEQLIVDIILLLSDLRTGTEKHGRDIYSYERRLAEIMPDNIELADPLNIDNPIKVSGLKISTQQMLPLQDILAAMYPDANINEETEVIVAQPEYLTKLSRLISSTDSATRNSYMIWTLVREYTPYLSSNFQNAVNLYRSEIYGVKEPIERWEFCANLVQKVMPLAIDAIMQKHNPINDASMIVNEMFRNITAVVRKHLEKYKENTDLYAKLEKKLDTIKVQVGLPEYSLNTTNLKSFYNKLNIIRSQLFANVKHAIIFTKKLEEQQLIEGSANRFVLDVATRQPASVVYLPSRNMVVIPRSLLSSPYFEAGFSASVNFARLGHEIAKAVVSSVLPFDSAWSADAKLLSRYHLAVNESLRLVRYATVCLTDLIIKERFLPSEYANITALDTYKHLSSLNIAHESMQTSLENKQHIHLPTLEKYEDSALFYLTHIQELCSLSTHQQDTFDSLVHFKLSDNNLLKVGLRQSRNLWKAFECVDSNRYECSDIF